MAPRGHFSWPFCSVAPLWYNERMRVSNICKTLTAHGKTWTPSMERDYVRLCHYAGYGLSEGDSRSQVPMFFELDKFLGRHELTHCTMENPNIWAYPIEKFPDTVQSDSVSEVCDYIRPTHLKKSGHSVKH